MTKIAMIGAGSVVFVKKLLADIFEHEEFANVTIALHDLNPERLETSGMMARWTAKHFGVEPHIEEHLNRREALKDADFVINMVMIGGLGAVKLDHEIPGRHGLKQIIGDTVGIGGIMRGLRTIPFMMELCSDMTEMCPKAYLLNYANPMSILTQAVYRAFPNLKVVGLCHNVQNTVTELAEYLGVDVERLSYDCAGINHMTWFLRLEVDGKDAYPALRKAMQDPKIFAKDKVRFQILKEMGWFVSESSRHFSEYVPHFLRDDGEIAKFDLPVSVTLQTGAQRILSYQNDRKRLLDGEGFEFEKSVEYGAHVIHAVVTNKPALIYGNVENKGLIDNLPEGCCVEVPILVDRNGLRPCKASPLPPELAAHCAPHTFVQELTVRAALNGDRDSVYRAAMLDRHTASALTLSQIRTIVDELIEAHGNSLPPGIRNADLAATA